jgi:hypothetical protein
MGGVSRVRDARKRGGVYRGRGGEVGGGVVEVLVVGGGEGRRGKGGDRSFRSLGAGEVLREENEGSFCADPRCEGVVCVAV